MLVFVTLFWIDFDGTEIDTDQQAKETKAILRSLLAPATACCLTWLALTVVGTYRAAVVKAPY